jgi:hypothetical protein
MKKIIIISALFLAAYSCNNNNKSNTKDTANTNSSLDTSISPNAVTEGSLNSNDTAAMRMAEPNKKSKDTLKK